MSRSWSGLLLFAFLLPACRTAAPRAPAAPPPSLPELLRPYEGALRVLPGRGDVPALGLRPGERSTGVCDVAVRVRSVAFDRSGARFALETIGQPRAVGRAVTCKRVEPRIELALTGFPAGPVTPETTKSIDEVLLTPDAYLRERGTAFDLQPGDPPSEVASQLTDANDDERKLARRVVAWPRTLLSVDPTFRPAKGRARYERLVTIEAVVGTDGRLHRPRVKTSLDPALETAVLGALPFWRFEPARRGDAPVGARVSLEAVLRVY